MTSPADSSAPEAPLSVAARPGASTGGKRIGVLLSHGFTGSPYSDSGPGAATSPTRGTPSASRGCPATARAGSVNITTWADWYGEVSRAFATLRQDNDAVVVGGLSMGGALALQLAEQHDAEISGLVLVNPAVATKRKDVKLLPVIKHLVSAFPAIANDIKRPGQDEHGYPKTPLKAAHSMMSAWRCRGRVAKVTRHRPRAPTTALARQPPPGADRHLPTRATTGRLAHPAAPPHRTERRPARVPTPHSRITAGAKRGGGGPRSHRAMLGGPPHTRGGQRRGRTTAPGVASDPAEGGRAAGNVTGDLGEHGVWSVGEITPGDVDDGPALRDERGPPPCGGLGVARIQRLGPARGEDRDPGERERGVDGVPVDAH